MKRLPLIVSLAVVTLTLSACSFGGSGGTSAPSGTPTGTPSATPRATASGSPTPTADTATTAGDCTATSGAAGTEIPVVYTVYGPNSTDPVTVTFTSFNKNGSLPVTTATFTGPVFTRVGYACTDAAGSADWTLTASSTTVDKVACVLDFGGMLVKTDSGFADSATPTLTTADCTGNPGK